MKKDIEKNKGIIIAGGLLLAAAVFVTVWLFFHYVMVNGRLYPKSSELLDLRDYPLTAAEYDRLAQRLPDTEILWNVPLYNATWPSNTQRLAVTSLSDQDVAHLAYFPRLQVIDGTGCTDVLQLAAIQQRYPNCQVLYNVTIDGMKYPQDTVSMTVSTLSPEDIPMLACLPALSSLKVTDCDNYDLLIALKKTHPQWNVSYSIDLSGIRFDHDAQNIVVNGISEEQLAKALPAFTNLHSITLVDPLVSAQRLLELRTSYPDIQIRWELTLNGKVYPDDLTEVDISHIPIDSVEQARSIGSYFPNLEKLIVDSGNISNDTMAQFREDMRQDYKVVWTVVCGTGKFGSFTVRTDETTFMPLKHGIYYFHDDDIYNVRYCEDMVCIDVGHMTFSDVSFVEKMPHLRYLILNFTCVEDISPLSSCKELIFLELDHTGVTDYSPLLECTALEDLNLGDTYGDPEPISQMTWLKNLWWVSRSVSVKVYLEQTLTDTYMLFRPDSKQTTGFGWRKLPNYYAMRDMLEMPYMD